MIYTLYEHFDEKLTHESLQSLRRLLDDNASCAYRTESIQVVSRHINNPNIHFVAPPPERIFEEMSRFIAWFNEAQTKDLGQRNKPESRTYTLLSSTLLTTVTVVWRVF